MSTPTMTMAGKPSTSSTNKLRGTALRCSTWQCNRQGLDQKVAWLRVKVAQPDWVILRTGGGVMTSTALKEAAHVGFPRDKIVGPHPTCAEQDMRPAGEAATGYICATLYGTGRNFPLI